MDQDLAHIQRELDRHATLFNTIERSPLTDEQRIAAVTMAGRNLLVAAAGSGKTSTMVGKVAYAICSGMCHADEILVLAFNRKAANELDVRLRERLAPFMPKGTRVTARTLHALGLDIVSQVLGRRPRVEHAQSGLLFRVLQELVHHDIQFAERWLLFRAFYHVKVRHPDQFDSHRQWRAFVRRHGECCDRHHGFLTLRNELVSTQLEQAIANWLYLHSIDYVYVPLGRGRRVMMWLAGAWLHPLSGRVGFFLPEKNKYLVCVRRSGRRRRHGAQALYITVDDFRAGTVFKTLRDQLCDEGATILPERLKVVLQSLGHRLTPGQTEFLLRFIRVARLSRVHEDVLLARGAINPDSSRCTLHAPMLAQLLAAYDAALQSSGAIDFEGMLHHAADHSDAGRYQHYYRLILVDEFQDTSHAGLRLLKSLLAQNSACKFFAVGDDWQSIYRFAGAVPDVLSRFEQHFGDSVVNHLTVTFRFNQSIADAASGFIQTNPAQLKKIVQARPADGDASVILVRYGSPQHMFALCEASLIDAIATLSGSDKQERMSVYILGRYQYQQPPQLQRWQERFTPLSIEFQTVHAAKGLEADVVIVLGLQDGRHGFPSQIRDDPLISLVMPAPETFPHAEERRLFYVAITRGRRRVYLLADVHQPSSFIRELEDQTGAGAVRLSSQLSPSFVPLC